MESPEVVANILQIMREWDSFPARGTRPLAAALESLLRGRLEEAFDYSRTVQDISDLKPLGALVEAYCYLLQGNPIATLQLAFSEIIEQYPDINRRVVSDVLEGLRAWTPSKVEDIDPINEILLRLDKRPGDPWLSCKRVLYQKLVNYAEFAAASLLQQIQGCLSGSDYFRIGKELLRLPASRVVQTVCKALDWGLQRGWVAEVIALLNEALPASLAPPQEGQLCAIPEFLQKSIGIICQIGAQTASGSSREEECRTLFWTIIIYADQVTDLDVRWQILSEAAEAAWIAGFSDELGEVIDFLECKANGMIENAEDLSGIVARYLEFKDDPILRFRYIRYLLDAGKPWDAYASWLYLADQVFRGQLDAVSLNLRLFDTALLQRLFGVVLHPPMPPEYKACREMLRELFMFGDGGPDWSLLYGYLLYLEFVRRPAEPLRRWAQAYLGLAKRKDVGLAQLLLDDLRGQSQKTLILNKWQSFIYDSHQLLLLEQNKQGLEQLPRRSQSERKKLQDIKQEIKVLTEVMEEHHSLRDKIRTLINKVLDYWQGWLRERTPQSLVYGDFFARLLQSGCESASKFSPKWRLMEIMFGKEWREILTLIKGARECWEALNKEVSLDVDFEQIEATFEEASR
jgi:hypothetical protein